MKKIITKFWGLALAIVLLSSLFVAATPVSAADPLTWNPKIDAPSGLFFGLFAGSDPLDYDVNGAVMYAAVLDPFANIQIGTTNPTTTRLLQSTSGGSMWTDISSKAQAAAAIPGLDFQHVAIAPDNANIIVTTNATTGVVISVDGGSTFTNMGIPHNTALTANVTAINGVKISPVISTGIRYIVVYGTDTTGLAAIFYYNYGAGVGTWKEASADFNLALGTPIDAAQANVYDFEFSPAFASDLMAVATTANLTGAIGDEVRLQMLNFNLTGTWNSEAGYPVAVYATAAGALGVNAADIALDPSYDGSDESTRIAFVGGSFTDNGAANERGGVFRCMDALAQRIYGSATVLSQGIYSVAYDGVNLAAGAVDTNNVYRTDGAMSSSPTFLAARAYKKIGFDDPGVNDMVQLKYAGDALYGGKRGLASAISKSTDYGNVWNDYTLLDSGTSGVVLPVLHTVGTITDIYVIDAMNYYIAANDAATASIYKVSFFAVTRVLCVPVTAPAQVLRLDGLASDPSVLYATDVEATGSSAIYFTDNGGATRWFARTTLPTAFISDVAVESLGTMYLGQAGTTNLFKSTNKAFSWGTAVDTKLGGGGAIFNIESLGEGQVLIGGTAGGVQFSTDGGATFTNTLGVFNTFGPVIVAASGLTPSDWVFAAEIGNKMVWRAPAAAMAEFKSMNAPAQNFGETTWGMKLINGVLYTVSDNNTPVTGLTYLNSTLVPTTAAAVHTAGMWRTEFVSTAAQLSGNLPEALKATVAGSTISLFTYNAATNAVIYLDDTVALAAPALIAPANETLIQIISALTGATSQVSFTWSRLSLSTNYHIQVSLDPDFNELLINNAAVASTLDPAAIIYAAGTFQNGVTYYWRVRSNAPFTSGWSEVREFTTQPTAASVPVVASPEIGVTIDNLSPAFSWTPVAGATMYRFELDTGTSFTAPLYSVDTAVAGAALPASINLQRGKTYFWRVKALTPVESDWSTVANFVVAEEAPAAPPPVTVTDAPDIIVTVPAAPAATTITVPPATTETVNPAYIWAIIIIGAVLVIAVIVLIVRTRRSV